MGVAASIAAGTAAAVVEVAVVVASRGGGRAVSTQMPVPPTGRQWQIARGAARVVVVEVGGALRSYTVGDRPVLDGYPVEEMCNGARGQSLLPWPNRLQDGRYEWRGEQQQTPLTEPEQGNAIHGCVRWANWVPAEVAEDHVVLTHLLHPQPGYPFTLALTLDYSLGADGLTVRTSATNVGAAAAPYGAGAHPYLTVGTEVIDECTLRLPGRSVMPTDDRGIPTAAQPVAGTRYDFTTARLIGGAVVDYAFSDLVREDDGLARVVLTGPGGEPTVTLWLDAGYRYLEIFTGDTLPLVDRRRRGLGVEPMTCAPNAFRTGLGLLTLEPGEQVTTSWGITPSGLAD